MAGALRTRSDESRKSAPRQPASPYGRPCVVIPDDRVWRDANAPPELPQVRATIPCVREGNLNPRVLSAAVRDLAVHDLDSPPCLRMRQLARDRRRMPSWNDSWASTPLAHPVSARLRVVAGQRARSIASPPRPSFSRCRIPAWQSSPGAESSQPVGACAMLAPARRVLGRGCRLVREGERSRNGERSCQEIRCRLWFHADTVAFLAEVEPVGPGFRLASWYRGLTSRPRS